MDVLKISRKIPVPDRAFNILGKDENVKIVGFELNPAIMYPAVLKEMFDVCNNKLICPVECVEYYKQIQHLSSDDWETILRIQFIDANELTNGARQDRANLLGIARKWFTARLKLLVEPNKLYLKITKDDFWKD